MASDEEFFFIFPVFGYTIEQAEAGSYRFQLDGRAEMELLKVVLHYANGKVVKGFTQDFLPNKDRFHLHPAGKTAGEVPAIEILVKDLKAIFFVRDFEGNSQYVERKKYLEGEHPQGRKMEVTFADGEVMVGSTLGYDPNRPGFFIFPADPKCNNIRLFAVTSAVKKVRQL